MSFFPQGSTPSTAGFTCNTCAIRFLSAELQRQHMKTDWHRYNLKRRVAQLPGISSEVFAEKVLASQKASEETPPNEDEFGFYVSHRRRGNSERQLTKKDLKLMARIQLRGRGVAPAADAGRAQSPASSVASDFSEFSIGDAPAYHSEYDSNVDTNSEGFESESSAWTHIHDSDDDIWDSDMEDEVEESDTDEISNSHCFYCGKDNHEVEDNIKHMSNRHGLYIPERSYLVDLDGLLTFVNEVICYDHECLYCGFEGKSLESVRQHMSSKGHCRIPYENDEEKDVIAEFYNFDTRDQSPAKLGRKKVTFGPVVCESDYDAINVEDLNSVRLPDGSRIMHRSLVRQARPHAPAIREDGPKTVALVDRRFAPGLTSSQVTRQERELRRLESRARNLHVRRTKSAKANYQAHFRDEILGT